MTRARPVPAIVAALLDETTITELTGQWVYSPEVPEGKGQDMPRHCVVVQGAGGGSLGPGARSRLPWRVVRLNVKSYGPTPAKADDLDARVYAYMTAFHRVVDVENETILHDAVVSGGPLPLRDPDTSWPYVLSVYDLSASPNS